MDIYKFKANTKDVLWEMSNITPSETGLDQMVWFQYKTNKEKHWARLKIKIDNIFVPITISDDPEIRIRDKRIIKKIDSNSWKKIRRFIIKNKKALLDFWNAEGEIGIDDLLKRIKKI